MSREAVSREVMRPTAIPETGALLEKLRGTGAYCNDGQASQLALRRNASASPVSAASRPGGASSVMP
jgi:hypothetical protein